MDAKAHHIRAQLRPPLDERVAELAGAQWGVVSMGQLRGLGLGRGAVGRRVRAGRLHPVFRGVYAVGHRRLGREARAFAAVLACGPGAVLSHRSAASWWGLLETAAARPDMTVAHGRHAIAGVQVHQARSLDARDTTTHEGIPITAIARTLLDLAANVRPDRLERALAQAERLQLYDHHAITGVIERANGHRGGGALARAIAQEPKLTRSELESRFLALVRRAGLPEPDANGSLDAPDHPGLEPDFCWPAQRLVVETDGWDTHGTKSAFKRDRRKDAALTSIGYRVMRFTYDDLVHEPDTVVARLTPRSAPA